MSPEAKAALLIVEDEFIVAQHLRISLESMGFRVVGLADNAAEAVDLARQLHPDLVLMDIFLAGPVDGIEAALTIRGELGLPVVFLTAQLDDNIIQRATAVQPYGYLNKPFKIKELQAVVETALFKASMEAKLAASEQRLRMILDATSDGAWDCDLTTGSAFFSEKWLRQLGRDSQDAQPTMSAWLRLVHPDDRGRLIQLARALSRDIPALDVQLRMQGANGQWRWCHCRGQAMEFKADGQAKRIVGTLADITGQKADQAELSEAREHFLSLAKFTSDALVLISHGKVIHFNPAYGHGLGYSAQDLVGVDFFHLLAPHERQRVCDYHHRRMAGQDAPDDFEADIIDKDGSLMRMRLRSRMVRHQGQEVVLTAMSPVHGPDEDRQRDGLIRTVLDSLPVGLAVFAADTGLAIYMNENYGRVLGWPRTELPSAEKLLEKIFPDRRERIRRSAEIRPESGREGREKRQWNNVLVQTRDRGKRYISTMSIAVPGQGVIISTVWDVDSQMNAERALAASEDKYRQLVENAGEAIVIVQDGQIRFCNPITAQFFGREQNDLPGQNITGLIHPDDRPLTLALYAQHQGPPGQRGDRIHRILRQGREPGWVKSRVANVNWEGRPAVLACLTDVTDGVLAQESLRERNETLQALITAAPLAVIGLDRQGKVLFWGGAAQAMFGWSAEEALGQYAPMIGPDDTPSFMASVQRAWENQEALHMEGVRRTKSGSAIDVNVHVAPVRGEDGRTRSLLGLIEDVTERRRQQRVWARIEAHLSQNRRLEAVGTLASGVAHEFNNILAAIIGYGELAMEDLEESHVESPLHFLDNQMKAAQRGRDLVRQILAFSRHGSGRRRRVDLCMVVAQQVKLMRAITPPNVSLETDLCDSPLVAEADPSQIQQVILNLTNNAIEALDGRKGVITFLTEAVDIEENDPQAPPGLDPGRYLRLVVGDNGPGMPLAVLERACEPFYGTKKESHNCGLGLAEVHGIITAHGGGLLLHSRLGHGARVEAYFPLCQRQAQEPAAEQAMAATAPCARVVFVDDERSLVEINQRLLANMGHKVAAFNDSRLALQALRDAPQDCDLLITDQSMPHLTGLELAAEAARIKPGLPVILCTGHSQQVTPQSLAEAGVSQLLYKPVDKRELAGAINRALADLSRTDPRTS